MPRFTTLSDARDYLREAAAQCPETISIYLDDLSALIQEPDWTTWVRELLMEYSFQYTTDVGTGLLTMEPSYYAGTRILHAAKTGDFSFLTPEELSAYDTAMAVVNQAKANTSSDLQLEKALHDYLCQTVTYVGFEDVVLPEDNTPHTILTAVGALVYGQANCQGFSDAFYLLGELAGFQVRRQDGWDTGEPHRWNTIERNGQWYIVDVTYDASSGDAGNRPLNYQWFNIGLDLCVSRTWNTVSETAPVAAITDTSLFYYTCGEAGFGTVFTDVNEMAAYLYETRQNQGQSTFYTMLFGQELTWESLSDAISAYASSRPVACSWTIWANSSCGNTYFLLDWTQWDP